MGVKDRALALLGMGQKSAPTNGSGIPVAWPTNWFQRGYSVPTGGGRGGSVVEACISAYAQTVAQLPGRHYQIEEDGTKTYVHGSNLARVLAKPNGFQTRSDFLLNVVYGLMTNGNAYWVGNSIGTDKPKEIFLLDPNVTHANRTSDGSIFYSTSGDFVGMADMTINGQVMIPERYVGHVRLHTPEDPLVGVTPLRNAAASVAANESIVGHQAAFFANMSRPSGVLSSDMDLTAEQMGQLRKAWEEHSQDMHSGGVPILGGGMKWQSMSINSQDAQMVEAWKMTVEDISRVFRVPPMLINNMDNSTFQNSETLMRFWLASGLGFLINHIELAFAAYYELDDRKEGVELDQEVLLRSDTQGQMESLGTGVTKGLMAPNEGRKRLGLSPVEGGDMPLVQQQMVPVNLAASGEAIGQDPGSQEEEPPVEEEEEPPVEEDKGLMINESVVNLLATSHRRDLHNAA